MTRPATTIIIVNYNAGEHLARCLDAAVANAPEAALLVVDNASSDGSEDATSRFPQCRLIRNAVNLGFGAAVNQAAATVPTTGFLLLLNPDCELLPGALDALHDELQRDATYAIAAPLVLDEDGSVQGSARGDPTLLTGLFGRTALLGRLFPRAAVSQRNVQTRMSGADESRSTDWVSGACMLVSRAAFEAVNGFDPRYFLYWEDADICRRLRSRGYRIRYVPKARVRHVGGRSSRTAKAQSIRAFHRSAFEYYRAHVARTRVMRLAAWVMLWARCQLQLVSSRLKRG